MGRLVLLLTTLVLILGAILSYPAYNWAAAGQSGLLKLWGSAGICWFTALLSAALTHYALSRSAEWVMGAIGVGMLFRMGVCLGAVKIYQSRVGGRDLQLTIWMVVFYLATLSVETTWFSRKLNQLQQPQSKEAEPPEQGES